MLRGTLNGGSALSGAIQREMLAVGGGDAPIKSISVDGVEIEPDSKKNVNIDLSGKADKTELPTKTSELTNDSGFITEIPSEYVTKIELENTVKDKADKSYVDTKVADLVNSAPETLDTIGEVAKAIQDNESVVDALNSAIGDKADKVETNQALNGLDERVTSLETSGGGIPVIRLPIGG